MLFCYCKRMHNLNQSAYKDLHGEQECYYRAAAGAIHTGYMVLLGSVMSPSTKMWLWSCFH